MIRYTIETLDGVVIASGAKDEAHGYWTTPDPAWGLPSTVLRSTPGQTIDAILTACAEARIDDLRWVWE